MVNDASEINIKRAERKNVDLNINFSSPRLENDVWEAAHPLESPVPLAWIIISPISIPETIP